MILVLLMACGADYCFEETVTDGEAVLEIDGQDWSGPMRWMLTGDSLQLTADAVDDQWVSIVAQRGTDGALLSESLEALPVEVDLVVDGWGTLYTTSDSDRSESGTLMLSSLDDTDHLHGCISFLTEEGVLVQGSFSAQP